MPAPIRPAPIIAIFSTFLGCTDGSSTPVSFFIAFVAKKSSISRCAVAYRISISESLASTLAMSVTSWAIWPGRLFISRCTRCVSQLSR